MGLEALIELLHKERLEIEDLRTIQDLLTSIRSERWDMSKDQRQTKRAYTAKKEVVDLLNRTRIKLCGEDKGECNSLTRWIDRLKERICKLDPRFDGTYLPSPPRLGPVYESYDFEPGFRLSMPKVGRSEI